MRLDRDVGDHRRLVGSGDVVAHKPPDRPVLDAILVGERVQRAAGKAADLDRGALGVTADLTDQALSRDSGRHSGNPFPAEHDRIRLTSK